MNTLNRRPYERTELLGMKVLLIGFTFKDMHYLYQDLSLHRADLAVMQVPGMPLSDCVTMGRLGLLAYCSVSLLLREQPFEKV